MKKLIASLMASMLMVSLIGCGPTPGNADTSSDTSKDPGKEAPAQEEVVLEKDPETGLTPMADADDPITFSIFVRDPGVAPAKDNPVMKKITELTGVTLDFEFLVGDLAQKQGIMIAGGEYPDAVFAEAAKFIDAGAFIPLEDMLPEYPNLYEHYQPHEEKMTAPDGHQYVLEIYDVIKNPAPIFTNGGSGFFMQKAVIEHAGYKIPKTVDEYFEMIEAYQAEYPTIDGVKTIGFEVLSDGWRAFCLTNATQHLLGGGNEGGVYVDPVTYEASLYQTTDTAKEYYRTLNEQYHKGTIEGETFTQSYDQYISRISTGAVLGFFDQGWNFDPATAVLRADEKFNRTYVSVPLANEGVEDSYLDAKGAITGNNGIGITVGCEEPERLLAFYDWLLQEDVQNYLNWGIEGVDYTVTEENDKILTDSRRAIVENAEESRNKTGSVLAQYSPKRQGLYDDGSPCTIADSTADRNSQLSEYDQNFLKELGVDYEAQILSKPVVRGKYYPVWAMTIEDGSPAKIAETKLTDLTRKYYPRLVITEPENYDALWDEYVAEVEKVQPELFVDEVNKKIDEAMQ